MFHLNLYFFGKEFKLISFYVIVIEKNESSFFNGIVFFEIVKVLLLFSVTNLILNNYIFF